VHGRRMPRARPQAQARSLDWCLRPVPLPATCLRVCTTRRGSGALRRGPCLHSVPVLPPELHVFSAPRRTVPIPLQAWGVEQKWSREGLNGDRHHPRSSRQQQTCRRSIAWPRAGLRGRMAVSPPATGSDTERRSATRPAPRSVTQAERAIRTAPNPGTSGGVALGASGGRRSARTASEWGRSAGGVRGGPRGSPEPDSRRRARPAT
jgi:hypothetical protein